MIKKKYFDSAFIEFMDLELNLILTSCLTNPEDCDTTGGNETDPEEEEEG